FSAAHPMLHKGKLYFSANLAGGKGKTDIYYAEKIDNQWANIKNCAFLNTSECEYFPYVINDEEIYFSSNRPGGYGKLDIYKCTTIDSTHSIQNLGAPINTKYDDFGVYIDSLQEGGYFSSDRKKNQDDIYFFKQTWPVFKNCKDPIVEDYCYNLTEESTLDSDSLKGYYYQWSFGDGTTQKGLTVRHCFPGPASYLINLNIIDSVTRAVFMSQASFDLKVDSIVQLKINCLDTVLQNKKFNINTDWTYLPDNKINGYYFEVDGKRMRGKSHDEVFADKGRHKVLLGVATYNTKTKQKELLCTTKDIICVDSATWLAVEKRQIEKIAEQFAFKKFPGDSALLTDMNYDEEAMKYNKKGINGALAAAEIKKIVDEKIANKSNRSDTANNNLAVNSKNTDANKNNTNATNTITTTNTTEGNELVNNANSLEPKYLNPIMDTLMNLKEEEDVTFKVNLGKSKDPKDTTLLNAKGINGIVEKKVGDEYQYTYGNEKKLKDIERYYDKTIKAGVENAVVVGYKNDSIIGSQGKYIKKVDFDQKKTKEDSLRIAKNIAAREALKNSLESMNAIQLRAKADKLNTLANDATLKSTDLKNVASTKTGQEQDSLLAKAKELEIKSEDQKLEASALNQKANKLDYDNNNAEIKELLTKLKKVNPPLSPEFVAKNAEISNLKSEIEKQKAEANAIPNKLERIVALNKIEEKEADILLKQDQLISELKSKTAGQIVGATNKNNTTKDQNNNGSDKNTNQQNNSDKNNVVNNTKNNNTDKNNTNTKNNTGNNTDNNSSVTINNTEVKSNASNNTNNSGLDENGFIATTDIQKTNLEFLEDFGDIEVEDLEFKVQVGVYKKRSTYHFPKLKGLGKVSNERLRDGSTRMTMGGSYRTLRQAIRHNSKIIRAGQNDAFVSVYYKGKRIGIENLKRKGVLVKTQVVTDSVSLTKLTINSSNLTEYAQVEKNDEPEEIKKEPKVVTSETPLVTEPLNTTTSEESDDFVFVPRTNIQKKTMFYAEKYGNIAADGLEFKVQIAIFKYRSSYSFPKLKNLGKIETENAEEGGTRMTIGGSFKTLNEAFEFNKKVVKAGQTDSFVAVYYEGKRIYIENLERRGIFSTNIKVDKAD
ncbi:MAG: PKD domain-containing protein, partial [Bacteroidia bacterium]